MSLKMLCLTRRVQTARAKQIVAVPMVSTNWLRIHTYEEHN